MTLQMSVVNCQSLFFPRIFWCTFYGKMCLSMAFSRKGAREKFPSIATRLLRTCQKKKRRKREKISDGAQSGLGVERGRGRYRLLEPEEGPGGEEKLRNKKSKPKRDGFGFLGYFWYAVFKIYLYQTQYELVVWIAMLGENVITNFPAGTSIESLVPKIYCGKMCVVRLKNVEKKSFREGRLKGRGAWNEI